MPDQSTGTLYLVATPIGNLSDISARAVITLQEVDFIAVEDTRITRHLLEHLGIKKPLVSYHKHNSRSSGEKILTRILKGENCALVSDAGTPGISDPGEDLVCLCIEENIPMIIIPGACAAVSAVTLSGLPSKRFTFEGFLSAERKKRLTHLKELIPETRTMIFYEAPHKLLRTLTDILKILGDRRISISREMTKIYEETLRMTVSEAISHFTEKSPKGEFVIVIEGAASLLETDTALVNGINNATVLIEGGLSLKDAVKRAAKESGCSRNALYKAMIGD